MKEFISKYKIVLLILALVISLVGYRTFFNDHFKNGAEKNALPALTGSNLIERSDPDFLASTALWVFIDQEQNEQTGMHSNAIKVNSNEILSRELLKRIRKNKGPVMLISDDPALSARAWMLLAQKGIDKLFIVSEVKNTEQFKYQFRPDSTLLNQ